MTKAPSFGWRIKLYNSGKEKVTKGAVEIRTCK